MKRFTVSAKVLEQNLATAIDNVLMDFEETTGYTPQSIDVRMVCVQEMGQELPRYIVSGVKTQYDLGLTR